MNPLTMAASAALSLVAGLAAAPAQAEPEAMGSVCAGKEVVRCVGFNVDRDNNRLRVWSAIFDATVSSPNPNFSVATSQVRLQRFVDGSWRTWSGSYADDHDGWHKSVDHARSGLVDCRDGVGYTVRAVAYQKWKGAASAASTQVGPTTSVVC